MHAVHVIMCGWPEVAVWSSFGLSRGGIDGFEVVATAVGF